MKDLTLSDWQGILGSPPPWVWDSAAPYFRYIGAQEDNNRFYWGCRLAVTAAAIGMKSDDFPWKQVEYETEHYPWFTESKTFDPDSEQILTALAEATIVREGSNFDMFLACWLWNMMLSLVDQGVKPGSEHERAFKDVIVDHKVPLRGVMLRCFTDVEPVLRKAQHRERERERRRAYSFPATDAWNAIELWHSVRHCIVHKDSVVDGEFLKNSMLVATWGRIGEEKQSPAGLREGQRLPLGNKQVTACLANYKMAAKALRNVLVAFSGEKRGHSDAPGADKKRGKRLPGTVVELPRLLLNGTAKVVVR